MWAYVTFDAFFDFAWPNGFRFNSSYPEWFFDDSRQTYTTPLAGDNVLNHIFSGLDSHAFEFTLNGIEANESKFTVDHVVVGMGMQSAATSLERVPKRTETFVKDRALNPLFQCKAVDNGYGTWIGNYTTTTEPVDLLLLLGYGTCAFNAPSNVSMLVLNGYARPDGGINQEIVLFPKPPLFKDSFVNLELDPKGRITAFKSKYVAPIVVDVFVLDPTVQYTVQIKPTGFSGNTTDDPPEYTALQNVTFYSAFADREPEGGGGPVDWDKFAPPPLDIDYGTTTGQPISFPRPSVPRPPPASSSSAAARAARQRPFVPVLALPLALAAFYVLM